MTNIRFYSQLAAAFGAMLFAGIAVWEETSGGRLAFYGLSAIMVAFQIAFILQRNRKVPMDDLTKRRMLEKMREADEREKEYRQAEAELRIIIFREKPQKKAFKAALDLFRNPPEWLTQDMKDDEIYYRWKSGE